MRVMTARLISALCAAATMITGMSVTSSAKTEVPKGRPYTPEAIYAPAGVRDLFLTKGPDETEYYVTWRGGAESGQSVRWARADALTADGKLPADSAFCPAETEKGISRARISGLEPSFSYAYQVGGDHSGWSDVNVFRAGGAPDGRFSFIAAGDPQLGASTVDIDTRHWEVTLGKVSEWFGRETEFLLCLGDQVHSYDKEEEYAALGTPDYIRSTPILTVPGNHDNEKTYSDHFTYANVDQASASRSGQYGGDYWVAHDGCLFLNINCVDNSGAVHDAFIGRAIEEYTALYGEPAWKFVSMHYSAYSGAADEWNKGRREKFSPIFSKYGVDAVLSGHDHVYVRSYVIDTMDPIDDPDLYVPVGDDPFGSYEDPTAGQVFYLTANSSTGSIFYELAEASLPWIASKSQENVPSVIKVDVEPDMLVFTTYRVGPDNGIGDVLDFFAIHRTEGVEEDLYAPVLTVPCEQYYDPDGEPVDLMKGVAAYDNFDRDVTASVTCEGRLDPFAASVITYTVADAAGNVATAERRMIPEKRSVPVGTADGAGGAEWAYLDGGKVPFDDEEDFIYWTLPGYDDSAWKRGSGSFGAIEREPFAFGINADVTPDTPLEIYFPDDSSDAGFACPNFFFRCEFDLDDPQNVASIVGDLQFNDAVEVYINGVNVINDNLPASAGHLGYGGVYNIDEQRLPRSVFTINDADFIASLGLKKTGNVLAVELYEGTGYTDDVFFNMKSLSFITRGGAVENPFTDVPEGKWFTDAVLYCFGKGYMTGTSAAAFSPSAGFTRAMFVTVLARIDNADVESCTTTSFADVAEGRWYTRTVEWAYQNGLTSGVGTDAATGKPVFGWKNEVTRQQLAQFFYTYSLKRGYAEKNKEYAPIDRYTDASEVAGWAKTAVEWAVGVGLISGTTDTTLSPRASATRAQVAVIVRNFVWNIVK
ncbi:MAG: S-layer homology domain-containing protein [Clostridia bacterium]|nr:S-layer homology domain-containing protein [Clostridia bacterium]